MFDFKNGKSFIYTKGLKLLAVVAAMSLIFVLIFDDKLVILEKMFRFTAIICQAMVLVILGTKLLIIEKNAVWGLICYIFVVVILGWIMYIELLI